MDLRTDIYKFKELFPDKAGKYAQKLHIKADDIDFVRKQIPIDPEDIKVEDGERSVIRLITTPRLDRDSDILLPSGAMLDDFRAAPTCLFAHNYQSLPVAKDIWLKVTNKGILAKSQYASHAFAEDVYQCIKGGFLTSNSVGFIPAEIIPQDKKDEFAKYQDILEKDYGVDKEESSRARQIISKWILLEHSDVPVASNASSLNLSISKGVLPIKTQSFKKYFDLSTPTATPVDPPDEVIDKQAEASTDPPADAPEFQDDAEVAETELANDVPTVVEEATEAEPVLEPIETPELGAIGAVEAEAKETEPVVETEAVEAEAKEESPVIGETRTDIEPWEGEELTLVAEGVIHDDGTAEVTDEVEGALDNTDLAELVGAENEPTLLALDEPIPEPEILELDTLVDEGDIRATKVKELTDIGAIVERTIDPENLNLEPPADFDEAAHEPDDHADLKEALSIIKSLKLDLTELKEGRVLSQQSRTIVKTAIESLDELKERIDTALTDLRKLYEATEPRGRGDEVDTGEVEKAAEILELEPEELEPEQVTVPLELIAQLVKEQMSNVGIGTLINQAVQDKLDALKGIVK